MANRRANFTQTDLTKVLKAYRDAGFPAPTIVIEPERITAKPTDDKNDNDTLNGWG